MEPRPFATGMGSREPGAWYANAGSGDEPAGGGQEPGGGDPEPGGCLLSGGIFMIVAGAFFLVPWLAVLNAPPPDGPAAEMAGFYGGVIAEGMGLLGVCLLIFGGLLAAYGYGNRRG
jgi:hypothetical protein